MLYCRENGTVMCTFPPHCTYQLQPLDKSVMGPFKIKLAQKQNSWLLGNPGKTVSIHSLPSIIRDAFDLSFTQANITASFKTTGVWPFDTTVFTDEDFENSAMTDRPATYNEPSSLMVESTAASPTAGLCHAATTTASTVAGSLCGPNIMNSSPSSSTDVAHTTSSLAGPSNDVDIPDT